MSIINLENEVEIFLEMVLPDHANSVQIDETRKAFLAGVKLGISRVY